MNSNREKYASDNDNYEDDHMVIQNDRTHAGTPAEFPRINIDNKDDGPVMELLEDTDK